MTKIKICGLFRDCDIEYVNTAMPDYIGFVFAGSRRQVTPYRAACLREKLAEGIIPAGVFVNAPVEEIKRLSDEGIIEVVQLHGSEDAGYVKALREEVRIPIIKAISSDKLGNTGQYKIPKPDEMIGQNKIIKHYEEAGVDYLLFDSGNGGTGNAFDWKLVPETKLPFFLAGGLSQENIEEAVRVTNPFGVDLSSGVETGGIKDKQKILEVVRRVRNV